MSIDRLERYVMDITEPMDYTLNDKPTKIIVEVMEEDIEGWNPIPPEHASDNQHMNVGLDFFAALPAESKPFGGYHAAFIRTGIILEMPYKYHMMIGSRSGLGFKQHIHAFPGIIDHSYRGEVSIMLHSPMPFSIASGQKVAQGIIIMSQDYELSLGKVDKNTERGNKGFGSTDKR